MPESSASLRQKIIQKYDAAAQTITLDATDFGDQIASLLDLINLETVSLTAATLTPPAATTPAPDAWSLAGTAVIWGVADCPFALTVDAGSAGVAAVTGTMRLASVSVGTLGTSIVPLEPSTTAGLAAVLLTNGVLTIVEPDATLLFSATMADGWSPFGLDQVHLEKIDFRFAALNDPDWGRAEKLIFAANLVIGSAKNKIVAPVEIDIPLGGGPWSAGIVPPGVTINGLGDIAQLLGGDDYLKVIPDQLLNMTALQLETLIVLFDPSGPSWGGIDLAIRSAHPWPIASNVAIEGVGLHLAVRPGNSPMVTGQVSGAFKVDILDFHVQIPIPLSGTIMLSGQSTQPLPGFGALASLVDASFAASLPDGIANLGSLSINQIYLNYGIDAGAISGVGFEVASAAPWTLIPNYLSFENLIFAINATRYGSSWGIAGGASGTITVATIPASVSVEGGAGTWVVKLTKPLVLPGITEMADLMGGHDAASALPAGFDSSIGALTIFSYEMDFGGVGNALTDLSLSFGTSEAWKFWDPYFVLERLLVTLDVAGPTGARTLDANIEGALKVANVTLVLSATKPASGPGWTFTGEMRADQGLAVGELIAYLLLRFKVTAPDAVSHFMLDDLGATFVTDTKAFTFHAAGRFPLAGQELVFAVNFDIKQPLPGAFELDVKGDFQIGAAHFLITFAKTAGSSVLTATWDQANAPIGFHEIADAFGFSPPAIPEGLDLSLTGAGFSYDFTLGRLALQATSQHYGQIRFVTEMVNGQRIYLLDLGIPLNIHLSDIPVAGPQIPHDIDVGIAGFEIAYASTALLAADVTSINAVLTTIGGTALGPTTLGQGIGLFGTLQLGAEKQPLGLPLGSPSAPAQVQSGQVQSGQLQSPSGLQAVASPATTPGYRASGKWIEIGKSFGPLQIDRIGVQYQDGTLMFALDAGIALGPLTLSMMGLGIGTPLTKIAPVFSISGLGLSYNKPPLEISGSILRVPDAQLAADVRYQFDGLVIVKAKNFGLSAIGSFAQMKSGVPSLFVFAQLEVPLGGPPAFFVTGLMAGFGFNRSLTIPGQDEVLNFPLLTLGQPPAPNQPAITQDPMHVLGILEGTIAPPTGQQKAWIAPQAGEYWLAAGLQFTSFELVNTRALLIVEFGHDLQIALLGLSKMQLPQPVVSSQTYAYVEMMIRVVIEPDQGYFAATAILSKNSYVLTPSCHLTGGFAFYLWFGSNPNAGQFVVTLGGYHPAFQPPGYYPQVPRLGFNWAVSSNVSIKGDAYFALTPSCIMAGGGLEVLFSDGDLHAWFTAQADFLISWHPFFYVADISFSIGVSYRLNLLVCHKTVTLSLGADLHMWGPPTGGTVRVDVVVVSFTVHFGSDSAGQERTPLPWSEFKTLLPDTAVICRIAVNDGLYKTANAPANSSGKLWIVRAKRFSFQTRSAIPASHLAYGNAAVTVGGAPNATIAIKPMNVAAVRSTHTLKIFQGGSSTPVDVSHWTLASAPQPVPESLWGAPPAPFSQIPGQPAAKVLDGQLCGISAAAPPPQIGASRGVIPQAELMEEFLPEGRAPLSAAVSPSPDYVPSVNAQSIGLIAQAMAAPASQSRAALHAVLGTSGLFTGVNGDLSQLTTGAGHLWADPPMQQV